MITRKVKVKRKKKFKGASLARPMNNILQIRLGRAFARAREK